MEKISTNAINAISVRFAPSPTGNLHIGGIRTALFNYLFALKNGGRFVLRIDDTDRTRSKKEYEEAIVEDLKWFDLKWDEFYRQSERISIYEKYLDILIENGLVYECYCKEDEILKSKEIAVNSKKPYIYNGKCLNISQSEKEKLKAIFKEKGIYPSIRLNIAEILRRNYDYAAVEFDDAVHGRLSFNPKLFGDFILKTEKNRFTYNFASIIDDYDLNITHVIRGEDHLSNTPKQILILKALEKKPPVFAHISLLYGKDGKIMSKRDAASNIKYYLEEGYLPKAILNYLAITGNTFTVYDTRNGNRHAFEKEIFHDVYGMAELLDIQKAKSSSAIFNEDKLKFINEKHLAVLSAEELKNILTEKFRAAQAIEKLEAEYGKDLSLKIIGFLKNEFKTVSEILKELEIFFDGFTINLNGIKYDDELRRSLLNNLLNLNDFDENSIKNVIKETASQNKKAVKECYEALRLFITGRLDGPSILKITGFLGKGKIIKRLFL